VKHDLIKTGDPDVFGAILDRNREVALNHCRWCGKGEAELAAECPARPKVTIALVGGDWSGTSPDLQIRISIETCEECKEPVEMFIYSPTSASHHCACNRHADGPDDGAAPVLRGTVRQMLVDAIAQIDARNGAPE
jgi:hypothetical protein